MITLFSVSEATNIGITFDRNLNWNAHVTSITRRCFGILSGLSHLRAACHRPSSPCWSMHWLSRRFVTASPFTVTAPRGIFLGFKNYQLRGKNCFLTQKVWPRVGPVWQTRLAQRGEPRIIPHIVYGMVHKVRRLGEPEELPAGFTTVAEVQEAREISARTTRRDRGLHVPRSRTEMGKRRFSCRGPMLYNSLPFDMTEMPVPSSFRLRRHLSAGPAAPDWRPLAAVWLRIYF